MAVTAALASAPALLPRAEIADSWRRSAGCGLHRDQPLELPLEADQGASTRLRRAVAPTLDELAALTASSSVGVVLTGVGGRVVQRRCDDRMLARELDGAQMAVGRLWQEQYAGTNAIALALERQEPSWVAGDEHYLRSLRSLSCVAVPLAHPLTQRIQGTLALIGRADAEVPLLLSIARLAGQSIEQRLYDHDSSAERALLAAFMAQSRHAGASVLAMSERVVMTTPSAATLLGGADKLLLWQRACDALDDDGRGRLAVTLPDGTAVDGEIERLDDSERPMRLLIRLSAPPHVAARAPAPPAADPRLEIELIGRTDTARHLRRQAQGLASHRVPVCVCGEAGAGKLTLARSIALQAPRGGPPVVIDAARAPLDGEAATLRQIGAAIEPGGRTVIVQHVECLGLTGTRALGSLILAADAAGSRILMTRTTPAGGRAAAGESRLGALELLIPPLRERIDDVLDLVPALLRRHSRGARASAALLRTLLRHDWPGNITELDCVLRDLLSRRTGIELHPADLPASYQCASRRMGRMEHLERTAILRALQETDGCKSRAAELLGIGRATLYRKIRTYGLAAEAGAA